ncbi:unnamed protein product [Rodentolepis nana]|uniref:GAGE domain-containing protein n=1 Tax=Rodentolepis nana TaxID=102285 RepID=A0A158QHN4_RODNA|nr:unnamed protein product [Rodentolepis nana]
MTMYGKSRHPRSSMCILVKFWGSGPPRRSSSAQIMSWGSGLWLYRVRIMENIMRSSEWSSSSATVKSPLRQAPEITQVKPTAEVQPKADEKDVAPIYADDVERSPFDDEEVLVDLQPKMEDCGE